MTRQNYKVVDLTGRKFGQLTVLRRTRAWGRYTAYLAQCFCGTIKRVRATDLMRKRSRDCGCRKGERVSKNRRVHGLSKHPLHAVWRAMLARCYNSNTNSYHNYGGRGIKVCRRWHKFENFWADVKLGYKRGLTLERKNNNAGYSPINCTWATRKTQAQNRRARV